MNLHGANYIAGKLSKNGTTQFQTFDPRENKNLETDFFETTDEEMNDAIAEAKIAFETYRHSSNLRRADFLRTIAKEIENLGEALFKRYSQESGLPMGRAKGECGRTIFQLKTFADHVEEGSYVEASIDKGDSNRSPIPKPDLRKMLIPIGPVAVFGASNFPLAYSTAGGDTASALAVGCPVIVKSHPMHAGTGELIASAIDKAVKICNMPKGVFSNLNSKGIELGKKLALHPEIKAIGFTGSIAGGRALYDLAASREEPIPVFAEMGSINPIVILPSAITDKQERDNWVEQYVSSIKLAAGQFCTNPGLILAVDSLDFQNFVKGLQMGLAQEEKQVMLHPKIKDNFHQNRKFIASQIGVETVLNSEDLADSNFVFPSLMSVSGSEFLKNKNLHREVFGPASLVVSCASREELNQIIQGLEGQLTATVLAGDLELINYSDTIASLQNRVGRIIFNGVPTGVEVSPSMVHGGPYPASTDSRFTAVGISAVRRWLRPFSYQNWPKELLPEALQEDNPLDIIRRVNGKIQNS